MDLRKAVQTDSIETVKELVMSKDLSINSKWLDYMILNTAIKCGKTNIAKFLLERKCRVNKMHVTSTKAFNTPLHNAVKLGNEELVEKLLHKKASIVALNSKGNSPLHLAFLQRQEKIVDIILAHIEQTVNYENPKNIQGLTHLHIACTRNNGEIVAGYIETGVNLSDSISAVSPLWPGFTALHFAVEFEALEAVSVIKKANGYCYSGDSKGHIALNLAYEKLKDVSTMVHILSKENIHIEGGHQTYLTYFHMACLRNDPEAIETFIRNGAEINLPISRDAIFCPLYTPLHFAVESNCQANVELLLRYGASTEFQNGHYMTPLHLALYNENCNGKNTTVDLLYKAVKNKYVDCTDLNGLSYFHVAVTRGDVRMAEKFLDRGEDVNDHIRYNLRNFANYTPLHFAVKYGQVEMVKMLIKYGANVNRSDMGMDGTPLHLAFEHGNKEIIALLLKTGARVNAIRPFDDKTMLHLLIQRCVDSEGEQRDSLIRYVQRLVRLGCNVNAKDSDGNTALHLACFKFAEGSECARLLLEHGADIDLLNNENKTPFDLSLYEGYKPGNGRDDVMLYEHVQKLKAIGIKISSENQKCCEKFIKENVNSNIEGLKLENLACMQQQRLDEINLLKGIKLSKNITLFDFLTFDAKGCVKYAQNIHLIRIIRDKNSIRKIYPSYGYLIRLQYQKGVHGIDQGVNKAFKKRPASKEGSRVSRLKLQRLK